MILTDADAAGQKIEGSDECKRGMICFIVPASKKSLLVCRAAAVSLSADPIAGIRPSIERIPSNSVSGQL